TSTNINEVLPQCRSQSSRRCGLYLLPQAVSIRDGVLKTRNRAEDGAQQVLLHLPQGQRLDQVVELFPVLEGRQLVFKAEVDQVSVGVQGLIDEVCQLR